MPTASSCAQQVLYATLSLAHLASAVIAPYYTGAVPSCCGEFNRPSQETKFLAPCCLVALLPAPEPGRLMAHFYLSFRTMQAITQAPQRADQNALLWIIAGASELSCKKAVRTLLGINLQPGCACTWSHPCLMLLDCAHGTCTAQGAGVVASVCGAHPGPVWWQGSSCGGARSGC